MNVDHIEPPDPWDPVKGETARGYEAFRMFLSLGAGRTLKTVTAQTYGIENPSGNSAKYRQVKKWSAQFRWFDRAMAYDLWREGELRRDAIEAERDMRRRHATVASVALQKAAEKLRSLNSETLSAREATALLDTAVRVERLARDVADRQEISGPGGGPISIDVDALERKIASVLGRVDEEVEVDE